MSSLSDLKGTSAPLQEFHDVALVDLDGVVYRGPHAVESAPEALADARTAGMRVMYVTNNANRPPSSVAEHLTSLGMPTSTDEVMTAAQAGALLLAQQLKAPARVLVVGGEGLRIAVAELGYEIVESADDAPDAVIQGFNPDLRWRDLAEGAYAVQRGAIHVATNLDLTIPNERGIAPGNGALVQAIVTATGVRPPAAGKPEPAMFHLAAERAGAENPVMIGDRLDTDLQGARAAGYRGLLVLTGVNTARDAVLAPPEHRPSYIAEDLTGLALAHPAPVREGDRWTVGGASASVEDGRLVVAGGSAIDQIRAACAAAWASADAGRPLDLESVPDFGVA
ncbi:HAD-IIA family hydrolase [Demequina sp. NBRC 110052]|uniref:HAD-IIA family hydrolase n=1 Tax=Demequina sp. NBRC 110052 TaxID=1570341 RepID=UPI000A0080E3|nr:HAD-IIA family hydrolase [Demequina sp. NBRC 110052]